MKLLTNTIEEELQELLEREARAPAAGDGSAPSARSQRSGRRTLSVSEACTVLGVSKPVVLKRIRQGRLKARRVKGRWFLDAADVESRIHDPKGLPFGSRPSDDGARRTAERASRFEHSEEHDHHSRVEELLEQLIHETRSLRMVLVASGERHHA